MFKKYFGLNGIIFILFVFDRLVKFWFLKNPNSSWDFLVGFLNFRLESNAGIAFGLPMNSIFLLALLAVIIFFLFNVLSKAYLRQDSLLIFSMTLIIAGAISNLIDRIRFGYVVDYFDVPFFTVFNLADIMITFGVIILLPRIFKKKSLDKP